MTRDEILTAALALFKSHFQADDPAGSMTAARAGLLLKNYLPNALANAGFEKFSDLLRELENNGSIRTGLDSKRVLVIWFPEKSVTEPPFRPLRDDIWRAFIARRPEGGRYLSRETGELRLGLSSPPTLSQHWIQLIPLSEEVQKRWAVDYLAQEGLIDSEINHAIAMEPWYFHFGVALENAGSNIARGWKRWRSEQVTVHVIDWCIANGVDPKTVFENSQVAHFSSPKQSTESHRSVLNAPEKDHRGIILRALAMMPTDDLLKLPIPSRYVFDAIDSDNPITR
jgi:hypothetical protein